MQGDSFWKGKRVLVGGGCGFLGSYLVPELVDSGAIVTVVDNLDTGYMDNLDSVMPQVNFVQADLRRQDDCEVAVRGMDVTINLAAKAFGMDYSRSRNGEMLIYNLACTLPLLEAAQRHGVERYVTVSSSCVYSDDAPVPTPELDTFTGGPEMVNQGYGWAKRIQELASIYYANEYGMKVTIVRPFNPYGANYRWLSEEKAHVIPALVKRILDGNDPLVVWGTGKQRRNFLHASDAARLIIKVVEKDVIATPINIGYEEDTSIAELVNLICELAGLKPEVVYDTSKPEGRFRKCADSTFLKQMTDNYIPRVSLREGIVEMVEWHRRSFVDSVRLGTPLGTGTIG